MSALIRSGINQDATSNNVMFKLCDTCKGDLEDDTTPERG